MGKLIRDCIGTLVLLGEHEYALRSPYACMNTKDRTLHGGGFGLSKWALIRVGKEGLNVMLNLPCTFALSRTLHGQLLVFSIDTSTHGPPLLQRKVILMSDPQRRRACCEIQPSVNRFRTCLEVYWSRGLNHHWIFSPIEG